MFTDTQTVVPHTTPTDTVQARNDDSAGRGADSLMFGLFKAECHALQTVCTKAVIKCCPLHVTVPVIVSPYNSWNKEPTLESTRGGDNRFKQLTDVTDPWYEL